MKRLVLILLVLAGALTPASAQRGTVVAGVGPVSVLPAGSLHNRFTGAIGGWFSLGVQTDASWTWVGTVEYVELNTLNTDKLRKVVTLEENGENRRYELPLPRLTMSLKAISLSAEARLTVLDLAPVETDIHVGFGFTYWDNFRSAYVDSLSVQSAISGNTITVARLAVPASRQFDWSGTLRAGCNVHVAVAGPVWLLVGAEYKLIIGELWPALDLDLEGVSGMQALCLKAGVSLRF